MGAYRFLLRLLPRGFRERNAGEMQAVARALLEGRRGPGRLLSAARACLDLAIVALRLRIGRLLPLGGPDARGRRAGMIARLLDGVRQDLGFTVRSLSRRPGFASVTTLVLALGIGATTTIFTVVNGVLLKPLPYRDAERIGILWHELGGPTGQQLPVLNPKDLWDFRAWSEAFEAFTYGGGRELIVGEGEDARITEVGIVEAGFFEFFGYRPLHGRTMLPSDDVPEAPLVVVLSHRFWLDRFGGDPSVVGTSLKIAGGEAQVIGVMPAEFRLELPTESLFLTDAEVWAPARHGGEYGSSRLYTVFTGLGRIRPDATFDQAQADLDRMMARIRERDPAVRRADVVAKVYPLQENVVKDVEPTLMLLFAAVGLTLLVSCANAANLLLGRGHARAWELSLRTALGAGRVRLFFIVLVESVVLAAAGGVMGIGLARAGLQTVRGLAGEGFPLLDAVAFDRGALLFAISISFAAALAAGLIPALRAASRRPARALAGSGRVSERGSSLRFRNGLVITEVATSLVLLVGAGLLVRSFVALQSVDPGYATKGLLTFRLALSAEEYPTADVRQAFYRELEGRLRALPRVSAVAAVNQLPLSGRGIQQGYGYDERTGTNWESVSADFRFITPSYFETLGATLVAGRTFTAEDYPRRVVIIDDRLAWEAFPDGGPTEAVGQRLQTSQGESLAEGNSHEIVGVVGHLNLHDLAHPMLTQIYYPLRFRGRFDGADHIAVAVQVQGSVEGLEAAVRREIEAMGPGIALQDMEPIEEAVARAGSTARISFVLMVLFGVTALALASIGLYGVLAFAVSHRTKEIGIRIALGQHPGSVLRLIVHQGMRLVLVSVAVGLVTAALVVRRASGLIYGVGTLDPVTYVSATVVLVGCALLACWVPARRAMRVDPIEALRVE